MKIVVPRSHRGAAGRRLGRQQQSNSVSRIGPELV